MTTSKKFINQILNSGTNFFIDIGCSNDSPSSQTEYLLDLGWSGLMFEYDNLKYSNQKGKMLGKDVKVINEKVTPDNVLELFKKNNVPNNFFLSLDIDGYDFYILEKILSEYNPNFIISEINEKIPHDVKFTVKFDEKYFWDVSHFYGYSIFMLDDLLSTYKYKILELDYNNVILIPGKQTETFREIYEKGYLHRIDRKQLFHYNSDFEKIYDLSKDQKKEFINKKFSKYEGKYFIQ